VVILRGELVGDFDRREVTAQGGGAAMTGGKDGEVGHAHDTVATTDATDQGATS